MNERLLNILSNLTDAEAEVEGLLYILNILYDDCERKNNSNGCYCIRVLIGWMNNFRMELLQSMNELDNVTIDINE